MQPGCRRSKLTGNESAKTYAEDAGATCGQVFLQYVLFLRQFFCCFALVSAACAKPNPYTSSQVLAAFVSVLITSYLAGSRL